ncbi:hypothetical protein LTR17_010645 [Elasticomyces elasticus]|nr:hypothetical protein LTR17_010645 [Elasticomyces elasticus]
MSSDIIEQIILRSPNLCGVKLTCGGNIAKLVRLTALVRNNPSIDDSRPFPFLFLDGLIADLTPWVQCGGHGTVSGLPNFAPRLGVKLWVLLSKPNLSQDEVVEAARLQDILSRADVTAVPSGVRGMKFVLNKLHGYGAAPRRPLLPIKEEDGNKFFAALKDVLNLEAELEALEALDDNLHA